MLAENTSLPEWLKYIENLHPKTILLGLERVGEVAEKLNLTHFSYPVITVGGTNGKGSCAAFLEAILSFSGYRVGCYTSPHLLQFNERIRINNIDIDDHCLCQAFNIIEAARGERQLTFFEFTTLAALWIFKQANLDVLILEVGLGGRLDAVNIVESDLALLTTISLDHTEWLGSDRDCIGLEKAGIFRSKKPAICGDFDPPHSIFQTAERLNSNLYCVNREFHYKVYNKGWDWESKVFQLEFRNLPLPHLPLQNAATALMGLTVLRRHLPINPKSLGLVGDAGMHSSTASEEELLRKALLHAHLPGRFQILTHRSITIILDVAHNPASVEFLSKRLSNHICKGRTLAIVGMLADKDIRASLVHMTTIVDRWYIGTLGVVRGCRSEKICQYLQDIGVGKCYNYDSIETAYYAALKHVNQEDRIVVFGSFHTVAVILKIIQIYDKDGMDEQRTEHIHCK